MPQFRTERLGRTIREKISSMILEGKIKDKKVSPFLSVTRVDVSKDLSYADVYVSDIRGTSNEVSRGTSNEVSRGRNAEKGAEGLQSAAGFIQSQLGAVMRIRKIPHLRFHADNSVGDSFNLIKKIEELARGGASGGN